MPVEDIVDSVYGLLVRDVEADEMSAAMGAAPGSGDNLSGLLFTGPGEIWVNAKEGKQWPGRRRFTISHELGHWVLHNTAGQPMYCRTAEVDSGADTEPGVPPSNERGRARRKVPLIESEADVFAACMLMPAHLVQNHYELCDGQIEQLMQDFNASKKAMERRVRHVVLQDRRRPRRPF